MTQTIEIECTSHFSTSDLLMALSARGIDGSLRETRPRFLLDVVTDDGAQLVHHVELALEGMIERRALPLVPQHLGAGSFVLRPPAG